MNYSSLVTAVQDYVENVFSTTDIDTIIRQAEQRIYNSVQLPNLRKNVTGATVANNKYLSCPNDFLSPYSMAVVDPTTNEYLYLLNKDVNFIREAYPNPSSTGKPRHYAIFGPTVSSGTITNELSFILGPTPDLGYVVELHYYYYPESIVTANNTWLSENFDSALLYGSIREAYIFLKGEPDMIGAIDKMYNEAMALLKQLGDAKDRQDAYRSGQVRYPVK